ncbi:MAG TPA: protealysin inhibitor emfourin [Terriglobales bacterium]|nr:protealysin inhibitor emfourin [Terriglobales bacterium]
MRVRFERSGGVAGITLAHDFDSADLSAEQTAELNRLVSEAQFFELPGKIRSAKATADLFQFTITVENGAEKHSIEFDQGAAPEKLRALAQWLTREQRNATAIQKRGEKNA